MQLHFLSFGQGDPVLILHGLFGSADNWQTIGKQLGESFRVFAVDLRNHGRSPHADEMDHTVMARDVVRFIDERQISGVSLIGHSLGGKIAMQTAFSFPDRVRKLVVVDIAPRSYPLLHQEILNALLALDLASLHDRKQADTALAPSIHESAVRQFLLKSLSRTETGRFEWKFNLRSLAANYERLNAAIPAGRFDGPTLFIRGEKSDFVLDSDLESVRNLFPLSRHLTIRGAGHWVHAEAPGHFLQTVSQFLRE